MCNKNTNSKFFRLHYVIDTDLRICPGWDQDVEHVREGKTRNSFGVSFKFAFDLQGQNGKLVFKKKDQNRSLFGNIIYLIHTNIIYLDGGIIHANSDYIVILRMESKKRSCWWGRHESCHRLQCMTVDF